MHSNATVWRIKIIPLIETKSKHLHQLEIGLAQAWYDEHLTSLISNKIYTKQHHKPPFLSNRGGRLFHNITVPCNSNAGTSPHSSGNSKPHYRHARIGLRWEIVAYCSTFKIVCKGLFCAAGCDREEVRCFSYVHKMENLLLLLCTQVWWTGKEGRTACNSSFAITTLRGVSKELKESGLCPIPPSGPRDLARQKRHKLHTQGDSCTG